MAKKPNTTTNESAPSITLAPTQASEVITLAPVQAAEVVTLEPQAEQAETEPVTRSYSDDNSITFLTTATGEVFRSHSSPVRLPQGSKWADYQPEALTTVLIDAVSFHKSQLVEQSTKASGTGETVSFKYQRKFSDYSKRERRLLSIAQTAINLQRAITLPTA